MKRAELKSAIDLRLSGVYTQLCNGFFLNGIVTEAALWPRADIDVPPPFGPAPLPKIVITTLSSAFDGCTMTVWEGCCDKEYVVTASAPSFEGRNRKERRAGRYL